MLSPPPVNLAKMEVGRMADVLTPEERSYNMSHIRSSNTVPEERVRKYLFSHGFRYRKNDKRYPGKPDIVLPKYHTIVFVNGCFWHMHDCSSFSWPKSRLDYWEPKLRHNASRDQQHYSQLQSMGWQVLVIWECQLKKKTFDETMTRLIHSIKQNNFSESSN